MNQTSSQTPPRTGAASKVAAQIEPKRRFSISRLALAGRPLVTISAKAS